MRYWQLTDVVYDDNIAISIVALCVLLIDCIHIVIQHGILSAEVNYNILIPILNIITI